MTFKKWSLAIATLMLVAPLSASALGISIANVSTVSSPGFDATRMNGGDVITFDLVLENATNQDILALGIGVYGYDDGSQGDAFDNRLVFTGGQAAASIFNDTATNIPSVGLIVENGIEVVTGPQENGQAFPINDTLRVSALQAVSASLTSNGNGTLDAGIAGLQTNGSDVHIQVSFRAQGLADAGDVTLTFGVGQFGNAALDGNGDPISGFQNASYTLTVIPEPGTALLMGLGLVGLASRRR